MMEVTVGIRKRVPVQSMQHARVVIVTIRDKADIGPQIYYENGMGKVFRNGVQIGYVSYNGRMWNKGDDTEIPQITLRKGSFALGGELYQGYTAGQTWNGWEWPLLPQDETIKLLNNYCKHANEVNELGPDEGASWAMHLDNSYELWDTDEDRKGGIVGFIAQGGDYVFNGEPLHLYDCGGCYCWEDATDEDESRAQIIAKLHQCLNLCQTQIETSGGEILEGVTVEDIANMRTIIDTVLAEAQPQIETVGTVYTVEVTE